jgi:CRP-like cAMP-binding protein
MARRHVSTPETPRMSASHPLKGIYLFQDLDASELNTLEAICMRETVAAGSEVFQQGQDADALYVINFGSVRIERPGDKVDAIAVTTLGTGAHFGELPFLDRGKRSATATALERVELTRIEYERLQRLLDGIPGMGLKVYRALARRLAGALRQTTDDLQFARETSSRRG